MWKLSIFVLSFFIVGMSSANSTLKIAGQEGDERFFQLIQAIYQEMGVVVEFRLMPAERALSLVNSGQFDAEVGRVPDLAKKYPNIFYSSVPILDVQLVAFIKKGSGIKLQSNQDLHAYRVGYLIGMSVAELFSKNNNLSATSVSTHQQLAKMLELDRLDVVLMGSAFSNSPVYHSAEPALVLSSASVYHIVHQKHASLAAEFDQVLLKMKKDGRYQKLLAESVPHPAKVVLR